MPDPANVEPSDAQLRNLRSRISDLGHQVDSYKTRTASALGGGVFLMLLAAGAAYDLLFAKSISWLTLGVTRETQVWIAFGIGGFAIVLLLFAIVLIRRRDANLDIELDYLEREYAELLERRKINRQGQDI